MWNFAPGVFPTGYALTIGAWQGTVVAPAAAVTLSNNGNFAGSIFAASLSGSDQSGFDPFGYGEPIPNTVDPLPALPEGLPIAMGGLALLGFVGLILRNRRRRHAVVAPPSAVLEHPRSRLTGLPRGSPRATERRSSTTPRWQSLVRWPGRPVTWRR